jgi:hypothetical protein
MVVDQMVDNLLNHTHHFVLEDILLDYTDCQHHRRIHLDYHRMVLMYSVDNH